jgi:hypothetical protein
MESEIREADVHEVLKRHDARYEVRPCYEMCDLHPVGASAIAQRVQSGFDIDLYGTLLEKEKLPLYEIEGAGTVLDYFAKVAQDIQSRIGQHCTVEVITYSDSLVFDTGHDFRPEIMLRIRIGHTRGLDQAEGSPEEQALEAVRQVLHDLDVREASK